eukprot:3022541-Ditylum_brightwellii.AAC.1
MEWVFDKYPTLKSHRMSSYKLYKPAYPYINPKIKNAILFPYKLFEKYLTGFKNKHVGVTSASMIVAVKESSNLTVYVGSHLDPQGHYLGRKITLQIPAGHAILFHQNL